MLVLFLLCSMCNGRVRVCASLLCQCHTSLVIFEKQHGFCCLPAEYDITIIWAMGNGHRKTDGIITYSYILFVVHNVITIEGSFTAVAAVGHSIQFRMHSGRWHTDLINHHGDGRSREKIPGVIDVQIRYANIFHTCELPSLRCVALPPLPHSPQIYRYFFFLFSYEIPVFMCSWFVNSIDSCHWFRGRDSLIGIQRFTNRSFCPYNAIHVRSFMSGQTYHYLLCMSWRIISKCEWKVKSYAYGEPESSVFNERIYSS